MTYHDPGVPYSTFRTSFYTQRKNTPAYSIGYGEKERLPEHLTVVEAVPGPGTYSADPAALHHSGALIKPGLYANTKWAADSTVRTNLGLPRHKYAMPPGPGRYLRSHSSNNLTGSTQLISTWRNALQSGWRDYSPRECQTPVVLSREHERERYGTHSPGPMTAVPVDSMGRQLTSNRKTQPRCTFGRSERFSTVAMRMAQAVPGPGAYNH
ncbi:hypothetical protein Vretimale_12119 [Volvox reticuliferus]|uniref:Flagellar associated protein n=2 Tax=Volvox reticuliferus TaxID=1737510 RepID=A0A8J4CEY2_9CHLO|nr:hypothetical protein Vretifemale_9534 [Volvox reticuliferus]GIM08085.1 hypothetical protein Vretimale_12119 [Volvox reticuliferus]